jgi:hypothetical protein
MGNAYLFPCLPFPSAKIKPGERVPNSAHEYCAEEVLKRQQRITDFQQKGTQFEIDEEKQKTLKRNKNWRLDAKCK